jgi:hypothetical protein
LNHPNGGKAQADQKLFATPVVSAGPKKRRGKQDQAMDLLDCPWAQLLGVVSEFYQRGITVVLGVMEFLAFLATVLVEPIFIANGRCFGV